MHAGETGRSPLVNSISFRVSYYSPTPDGRGNREFPENGPDAEKAV